MKKWILVLALLLVSVPMSNEVAPLNDVDLGNPK